MFEGPIDVPEIHAAWCSCSDCTTDRRRTLRGDLRILALGVGAALAAIAAHWVGLA